MHSSLAGKLRSDRCAIKDNPFAREHNPSSLLKVAQESSYKVAASNLPAKIKTVKVRTWSVTWAGHDQTLCCASCMYLDHSLKFRSTANRSPTTHLLKIKSSTRPMWLWSVVAYLEVITCWIDIYHHQSGSITTFGMETALLSQTTQWPLWIYSRCLPLKDTCIYPVRGLRTSYVKVTVCRKLRHDTFHLPTFIETCRSMTYVTCTNYWDKRKMTSPREDIGICQYLYRTMMYTNFLRLSWIASSAMMETWKKAVEQTMLISRTNWWPRFGNTMEWRRSFTFVMTIQQMWINCYACTGRPSPSRFYQLQMATVL